MGILSRFNDIIQANINAALDTLEDPSKMIDQYLINMTESLAEVKKEAAGVLAEETRTKRLLEENKDDIEKYASLAKKALQAGNEGDAKVFISKKQEVESAGAGLATAHATAHENAEKMRQMHDKLVSDIQTLNSRREMVKAKVAVARTQQTVNEFTSTSDKAAGAASAFDRMEDKANRMLDEATAMAELNTQPIDEAKSLEEKYENAGTDASVDEEMEKMKKDLGL